MAVKGGDALLTRDNIVVKPKNDSGVLIVRLENNDTGISIASYTLVASGVKSGPSVQQGDDGTIFLYYIDTSSVDHKWKTSGARASRPTAAGDWVQVY